MPLVALAEDVTLWGIPQKKLELQQRVSDLEAEMEGLPKPGKLLQDEAYGYHSSFLPALDFLPEKPRWTVECSFRKSQPLQELVLIPAYDRRFGREKSYGFPKRFRIVWIRANGDEAVVCEWMDEDCPDPGWAPLSIRFPEFDERGENRIRIEVFRGVEDAEREFFALDEVFGIISGDVWLARSVKVSGALKALPYWSPSYLIDQRTSLGLPTESKLPDDLSSSSKDFSSELEGQSSQKQIIELDLKEDQRIGWLNFFPATPVDGVLIPNFGFPQKIEIILLKERAGRSKRYQIWSTELNNLEPGNNVCRVPADGKNARWIRIILHKLPENDGVPVVGIGEIHAFNQGKELVFHSVSLSGFPKSADEIKYRLIDKKVDGRRVMLFRGWLKGLERRQKLSRELAVVENQLDDITVRWDLFWSMLIAVLIGVFLVSAIGVTSYTLWQRKRKEANLRERIAMDLHDDIGSRISAMALGATYIQRLAGESVVVEQSGKLRRLAEQMQSSLADVLWFTDHGTDSLRQLLEKLESIAKQVVRDDRLAPIIAETDNMPDSKISVMFKRDAILIFREIINNAVKHSSGDKVEVQFRWQKPYLIISVSDNGVGFDLEEVKLKQLDRPQLGVNSMNRRAERLGANLEIKSIIDQGTLVILSIKF